MDNRFEVEERVLVATKYGQAGSGRISNIAKMLCSDGEKHTIYTVDKYPFGDLLALDGKEYCKYESIYPIFRIYKIGETDE